VWEADVFTPVIFYSFFFISGSLILGVRQRILLKFDTLAWRWCNLWTPVPNGANHHKKFGWQKTE